MVFQYKNCSKEELIEMLRLKNELIDVLNEEIEVLKDNSTWYKMKWLEKIEKE